MCACDCGGAKAGYPDGGAGHSSWCSTKSPASGVPKNFYSLVRSSGLGWTVTPRAAAQTSWTSTMGFHILTLQTFHNGYPFCVTIDTTLHTVGISRRQAPFTNRHLQPFNSNSIIKE